MRPFTPRRAGLLVASAASHLLQSRPRKAPSSAKPDRRKSLAQTYLDCCFYDLTSLLCCQAGCNGKAKSELGQRDQTPKKYASRLYPSRAPGVTRISHASMDVQSAV
jgi:hypothetical protein